jgi:hypothetical protein
LPTDSANFVSINDKERVYSPNEDLGKNVVSAKEGPLSDAFYKYASLQVIKDTKGFTKFEKNIFEKYTAILLKDVISENNDDYFDINKTIGLPSNISYKIQVIQFFIYYERNNRILFYRYPKTGLTKAEIDDYDPKSRPWYKIDGTIGISDPYYSYSTKQKKSVPIRTLVKKVKANDSEIIFGIDAQLK